MRAWNRKYLILLQMLWTVPGNGSIGNIVSYTDRITNITAADKLAILMNLVDTLVYACISECTTHHYTILKLDDAYIKRVNKVYARYQLSTCRQVVGESLQEFLQSLQELSTDCNFMDVTAAQYQEATIRYAFIAGCWKEMTCSYLVSVINHVYMLDNAQCNAGPYTSTYVSSVAPITPSGSEEVESKPRLRSDTGLHCRYTITMTVLLETKPAMNVVKRDNFQSNSAQSSPWPAFVKTRLGNFITERQKWVLRKCCSMCKWSS